ncbi:hypothetical protein [Azonexus sp.]|jgi:hypothetical protein|uniref:hypothetical protein n=1 Tax=Azonexus sp. TaxID=1872668 RepID=UPI00283A27EF|nr:hypothetical protein [Azonexus sp.]MDR1995092.1 hypothetical protein [Azonexus sp.]
MMQKKALIHIGTRKTGSTSIQIALSNAAGRSALGNIAYPELDPIFDNCQHYLDLFYRDETDRLPHFTYLARKNGINVPDLYRDFQDILAASRNIILSTEGLPDFDRDSLLRLKNDLDTHGYTDTMVVLYVREPSAHYRSILQEVLKVSRYCYQPSWHNYLSYVRQAIHLFTEIFDGRLCVREFNRAKLAGHDIVTDFAEIASAFFNTSIVLDPVTENEALSAEAAFILHRYRNSSHFYNADEHILFPEIRSLIDQLLEPACGSTKLLLCQEVADFIANQNAVDALRFKEKYGVDFCRGDEIRGAPVLSEPLRLDEIIIKPNEASIERIESLIAWPSEDAPACAPSIRQDEVTRLSHFMSNQRDMRKVIYGGGAFFLMALYKAWLDNLPPVSSNIRFVDGKPGVRRCRDREFNFVSPADLDWSTVDEVLICAPGYDAEIRTLLLERNKQLKISSIRGQPAELRS